MYIYIYICIHTAIINLTPRRTKVKVSTLELQCSLAYVAIIIIDVYEIKGKYKVEKIIASIFTAIIHTQELSPCQNKELNATSGDSIVISSTISIAQRWWWWWL